MNDQFFALRQYVLTFNSKNHMMSRHRTHKTSSDCKQLLMQERKERGSFLEEHKIKISIIHLVKVSKIL